jgi:2-polyprenyl-3-methyl-5-hydroxy-6-metoxy-1,4-benzoquinol methylase
MYDPLAKAFETIFPVDHDTVAFALRHVPEGEILDLACGSGGYSIELAKQNRFVVGIDLSASMIETASQKARAAGVSVDFRVGDMTSDLGENRYAGVLFIGNSLVHAKDLDQIKTILAHVHRALLPGGAMVLQILNYDRIQAKRIRQLPLIEQAGVRFERRYVEAGERLRFVTTLKTKEQTLRNEVLLVPIRSEALRQALKATGWTDIVFHDDFTESAYDPNETFALVVTARKGIL